MSDTTRLGLPLLQPAQAQKHVTVNEALMRLDGTVNLVLQSTVATSPPGAVIDGRDIGTVICPEAEVKLFVTASPEVRARRRHAELTARGETVTYDDVLADLKRRDARDAGRAVSPLAAAPDAHLLDTSDLDIEAAFRAAVEIVQGNGPVV